ncbi:hypothetical protein KAS79_00665 [Candidatus Parcubacteria bacterium]|nr:hypothetical protein [Candidatus Parcubacteria bacterium]
MKKISNWIHGFDDKGKDLSKCVKDFLHCHTLWYGNGGPCSNCTGREICLKLKEEGSLDQPFNMD